jgi:hypothetical protein
LPIDAALCATFRARFPEDERSRLDALDGVYYDVEALSTAFITLVCETPSLREHLTWLVDEDGRVRALHFVFATCPDGHPFVKAIKDGATSAPVECLNLGKVGHLSGAIYIIS